MSEKLVTYGTILFSGFLGLSTALFLSSHFVEPARSQSEPAVPAGSEPGPPTVPAAEAPPSPENNPDTLPPQLPPAESPAAALPPPDQSAPSEAPMGPKGDSESNLLNLENAPGEWGALLAPYVYDQGARRDPFVEYVPFKPSENRVATEGPLLPQQRYDLEQFTLLGIIWDVRRPKAMFKDPENQILLLERDDRIGRNNGYIAVIREGEVVVIESVNSEGNMSYMPKVIRITR